ncbi:MAG: hypothetical protein RLZZ272_1457 [Actinomycetota bacterium]
MQREQRSLTRAIDEERMMPPWLRTGLRLGLAAFLTVAGAGHFVATSSFLAQVPRGLPYPEAIVLVSGAVELALALALVALPRWRVEVGRAVALLFVVVLPGNVAQAVSGIDAFGLDTPTARWVRVALHPLLLAWAFAATDSWPAMLRRARQ